MRYCAFHWFVNGKYFFENGFFFKWQKVTDSSEIEYGAGCRRQMRDRFKIDKKC